MAIDTRAKRQSMLNFSAGALLPHPDTSGVSAAERATFLDLYEGIPLGSPVVVVSVIYGTLHRRRLPHLTTRDSVREAQRGSERYWGL